MRFSRSPEKLPIFGLFSLILVLCLPLVLASCGGGTEGTGFKSFAGVISGPNGQPSAGVSVTLEETGTSTTTDTNGYFEIPEATVDTAEVTFRVEDQSGFSATAKVSNLPSGRADVALALAIDQTANTVVVTSVVIVTPTLQPTIPPSISPTSAPLPTATATPALGGPSATPTTGPVATTSPTPTITPTIACVIVIISDPCVLDLDLSGNVNVADFTRAIQLYAAHDLRMDIDGNGILTTCDIDSYGASVNALTNRDCPAHASPTPTPTP